MLMIVRKNEIGYYTPNDSVDTRLYMTDIEAFTRLHELQAETKEQLTIAEVFF
jgi:hypothetical protein